MLRIYGHVTNELSVVSKECIVNIVPFDNGTPGIIMCRGELGRHINLNHWLVDRSPMSDREAEAKHSQVDPGSTVTVGSPNLWSMS